MLEGNRALDRLLALHGFLWAGVGAAEEKQDASPVVFERAKGPDLHS